jgi:hypothetical protein
MFEHIDEEADADNRVRGREEDRSPPPVVEVTTNLAGAPVLKVRGCFIADQHPIARLNLAHSSSDVLYMKRELFLGDAPDTQPRGIRVPDGAEPAVASARCDAAGAPILNAELMHREGLL